MSIAATVTESDSVSVSHTADAASTDQQAQSTHHLQSSVRQTLSTIINYTYLITDRNFTKKSLHSLQQQLQQFHHWADHAARRLCFHQSRKLVNSRLINWCVAVGIWLNGYWFIYIMFRGPAAPHNVSTASYKHILCYVFLRFCHLTPSEYFPEMDKFYLSFAALASSALCSPPATADAAEL